MDVGGGKGKGKETEGTKTPNGAGKRQGPGKAGSSRSWSKVARGSARPSMWTTHEISAEELEEVQRRFPKVLELTPEWVEMEREAWSSMAVIARSLGRRVPVEWAAREMKARGKLEYEVEAFPMASRYFALRFRNVEEDREAMLVRGPWIIAGQLLGVERWQPDFVPGRKEVNKVVVWLRLPGLPLEYWRKESIWEIATEAGIPIEADGFTEDRRRMGYARVKVEVNASLPVRPGVFIRGKEGKLWQTFTYEYL
ncbi:uncharacterized protein LOC120112511 [Phoenix dactylifera]|uniref:Uncharacterized protein LOC120112511 n=1 Tax=Phoenix dactylifera TaxID=42345 RepID=A0A8B9AX67_PHODC|nr:uncharacterized protein LOC120112511 [Phoenix dactylifera]